MIAKSQQVTKPAKARPAQPTAAVRNRVCGFAGNHTMMRKEKSSEEYARQADATAPRVMLGAKSITRSLAPVSEPGTGLSSLASRQRAPLILQKQDDKKKPAALSDTASRAKAAFAKGDKKKAEELYRESIAADAAAVTIPAGVPKIAPKADDIRLDFKLKDLAQTRAKEVPANENNYWHWIFFGPEAISETPAHTESVITHELVHVGQFQTLWNNHKKDKSAQKVSWDEFLNSQSTIEQVKGPVELEAHITSLGFLTRLSKSELVLTLRPLFVAYANTSVYQPPKGEPQMITTAVAGPQILQAYNSADSVLQELMGAALWWALISVDPPKATWIRVLSELKPISTKGYSDPTFRPSYDDFLKTEDLTFSQIGTGGKKAAPLRRKAKKEAQPFAVPNIVREVLRAPGQPLGAAARAFMEPRFGHDFSNVRVHTDERAVKSAEAVNALAYTVGRHVVFAARQYGPQTNQGRRLLAHELTHVVQQSKQSQAHEVDRIAPVDDRLERAADRTAAAVLHNRPANQIEANSTSVSATPALRRDPKPALDFNTIDWDKGVAAAQAEAKQPKTMSVAEDHYKELIIRAASKVVAPAPLKNRVPDKKDIIWNWKVTKEYAATTDPKKVDKAPDDYWKWLTFNPAAVQSDEAFTVSTILHELDHAAHAKALFDEWKKAKGKGNWEDFYLAHYDKWTEKEIKLPDSGVVGALGGLPEKLKPSAIEFRAYANQFVNFFHKVSLDNQKYYATVLVLFYPLKTQKVEEPISDPNLDLSKARDQVLDYFKSPPVKDAAQQEIIKRLIAVDFKSALGLFRPVADRAAITADFKDILSYEVDSDQRKDARAKYKPEAL